MSSIIQFSRTFFTLHPNNAVLSKSDKISHSRHSIIAHFQGPKNWTCTLDNLFVTCNCQSKVDFRLTGIDLEILFKKRTINLKLTSISFKNGRDTSSITVSVSRAYCTVEGEAKIVDRVQSGDCGFYGMDSVIDELNHCTAYLETVNVVTLWCGQLVARIAEEC